MKPYLVIVVVILCAVPVHSDVVFTPPEWVFGEIGTTEPLELACRIENTEDQTLQIRILPTCGCLTVDPPELSIPSGGQAEIILHYDPIDDRGEVEHFYIVQTNLEVLRKALFSVRGTVADSEYGESPETELK